MNESAVLKAELGIDQLDNVTGGGGLADYIQIGQFVYQVVTWVADNYVGSNPRPRDSGQEGAGGHDDGND